MRSEQSENSGRIHIPVLQKEVLEYLNPKANQNFVDCTIGWGGHAIAIIEKILPKGKLLGIDWDEELIRCLRNKNQKPSSPPNLDGERGGRREQSFPRPSKIKNNLILVCDNFVNLKEITQREKLKSVEGILFDLGMSSWHLQESGRGFSFLRKEPLDMRYNLQNPLTAEKIVNYWSKSEIEKILREYGEEPFAGKIAEEIIKKRKIKPFKDTFQLIEILKMAIPFKYRHQRLHFATKTFQALRIAVNDELENLKKVLPQAIEILKPGGKLLIISFHSLEDRIVKNFFRNQASEDNQRFKVLTKKPVRASEEEIKINPRSRSARLRAILKI